MPPKRKRPSDIPDPHPKPSVTRRATRQTPVPPPPVPASVLSPLAPNIAPPTPGAIAATTTQQQQPQLQPRLQSQPQSQPQPPYKQPRKQQHKKLLPNVSAHPVTAVPLPSIIPKQQKRGRLRQPISVPAQDQTIDQEPSLSPGSIRVALPPPRRVARVAATETAADGREMGSIVVKENIRPSDLVAPEITYHVPHINQTGRQSSLVRPHGPSAPPPRLDMMTPLIVTPVPPPRHPMSSSSDRPPPRPDRNIDKVVLGNLCFRTWYPSYYGKEILGDTSANVKGGFYDGAKEAGSKAHAKKDKDHQPMLDRLYVCPSCFKYAKEIVAWWGHVRLCQRKGRVPGRKIYVHPRGRRTVLVAYDASKGPGPKKRRGENGPRYVEETVQDEGEWSVWEVDGEEDGLFCQNLSLFAKLFLDNKSVFFDVTGFNYYLLVYTPPSANVVPGTQVPPATPTPQITGFFSKEKMSWDNNNLACILVFPPWQRKGLGAFLMGVSYEISRREGIMGGPEKPISDLGKKGYKRFWSGEIARWLLDLDIGPENNSDGHELIVDIEDCSQGTWISPEDCLMILREMGIVEDAGIGPGKHVKDEEPQTQQAQDDESKKKQNGPGGEEDDMVIHDVETKDDKQKVKSTAREVHRVRVDKEAVRRYVSTHRIHLDKACDPAGFAEGYAIKSTEEEEVVDEDANVQGDS